MRSKFHNEYMQMLSDCLARYPRDIDPITLINQYGFSRVKSFIKWLDSKDISYYGYFPNWFDEFLSNPDSNDYDAEVSYPQLQKIIRTSTDPTWISSFVRYYAKTISPKYTLFKNTEELDKTVLELTPYWCFNALVSEEKQEEIDGEYEDIKHKVRVNKNTVRITVSAVLMDDEETEVYTASASIPRNIPTVIELVRYLRDDLGSEQWSSDNLETYIQLYTTYGWDFNLQPLDKYEDWFGDLEPMWKLTRRISKRKLDQLRDDANAEVRQIVQAIMNNNRREVQPFIDYEDNEEYLEDFEAESWGGDPDGQLAQALARARSQPRSPLPVEITELPKVCAECGGDSPQAFGLFDESDRLISEAWFCDSSCADKNLSATQISFGADEKKNSQVKCPNCSVGYLTDIPRYERVRNKPLTCDSCRARFELCDPTEIQRLKNRSQKYTFFRSESEDLTSEMVITDNSALPDPVSWIIWLADPPRNPRREYDPAYAELFFVQGPGQRVRMEDYRRTAEVNGVYGAPFMVTQNMDEQGWLASTVTIRNFTDESGARSLSVGDIIEDSETGTMWIVAPVGYYQLEPAPDTFSAPLARHPLNRFKPRNPDRKSASYWRKRGKDAIFRPERTE